MKRLFASILALVMFLSMAACGGGEPEPTLVETEITLDNWFVYFDITEAPEEFYESDQDGTGYYITLKDEYADGIDPDLEGENGMFSSVEFMVAYDFAGGTADDSGELLWADYSDHQEMQYYYDSNLGFQAYPFTVSLRDTANSYVNVVQNIEVTGARGKLYFPPETAEKGAAAEAQATPLPTAEPAPEIMEIELTLDNWGEYFEVVEHREEYLNVFDELDNVSLAYYIALKPEFIKRLVPNAGNKAAFMFSYEESWRYQDWETGELSEDWETSSRESDASVDFSYLDYSLKTFAGYLAWGNVVVDDDGETHDTGKCENFEATRVAGTIYLYEN